LHGAGEQAVGDVPDVGLVVGVGDPVTEVDGFTESFAERVVGFLHGLILRALSMHSWRVARIVPEASDRGALNNGSGAGLLTHPHIP
jgi:hypothetical protein